MCSFKYELKRGNGTILTSRDLNWFEKLMYRIRGYEVIKLSEK